MTSRRAADEYTAPVEDYLKTIYELELASGAASTNDIAGRLSVAPASVSGMVRRLADQGLLEHEKYRGVRLTDEGRRVALGTIRRHRVIETYLTERLGYPWDLVHEEAERLEHAASDALIDRMAAALGEPTVDPHGAPIPTREGEIDEGDTTTLADLEPGESARIVRVSDDNPDLLRYLDELGLTLGTVATILDRAPFDGPIALRVGVDGAAVERVIGPNVAAALRVEREART
ncbi:MAG TPA: metal-dependent transcriptional regulator [Longimicrobiales bacterium]